MGFYPLNPWHHSGVTKRDSSSQFPPENPGESQYEKESREADEVLAKKRAASKKTSAKPKRESGQ